jgi:hypothetical protein
MKEIETPHDVVSELASIRKRSEDGLKLLADAERKAVTLELAADTVEAKTFISAQGTIADRQAVAKLAATDARLDAELARVELSRIKSWLKHLTEAQMSVQTSARMVELQWRTAGIGER